MAALVFVLAGFLSILAPCGQLQCQGEYITDRGNYNLTVLDKSEFRGAVFNREDTCPTWFHRNGSGVCVCGSSVNDVIWCDPSTNQTSILTCNCMTDGELGTVVGSCVYNCFKSSSYTHRDTVYRNIPKNLSALNNYTCSHLKRSGTLCGDCMKGYYLAPYTYDLQCFNCTYSPWNWAWYIAMAYGPLTVFFIIMVSFRISIVSGQLTGFVNFSQAISVSMNLHLVVAAMNASANVSSGLQWSVKIMAAVYGVWNLDFLRTLVPPICLNVNSLQATALDYGIAAFPLVLIVMTYIIVELDERNFRLVVWAWRPLRRCFTRLRNRWDVKTSIIDSFATFLFLSYMKVLTVSGDILNYGQLYDINGNQLTKYVFDNASVEYFGAEHLPYALAAIAVLIVFVFLPLVLLLLYPLRTFQRFLDYCHLRTPMLTTLVGSVQGCYKDGTDGTRDCRYFSTTYIIIRILIVGTYALTHDVYTYSLLNLVSATVAILYLVIQPYKKSRYNYVDAIFFLNSAMWCTAITALSIADTKNQHLLGLSSALLFVFSTGPFVYITVLFHHWIVFRKRFPQKMFLSMMRFFRVSRFTSHERFTQSLPHRLLYPNEYNRVAPLASQVPLGGEYGSVGTSDGDSASNHVSEELWSAHDSMYTLSEEESDSELSTASH